MALGNDLVFGRGFRHDVGKCVARLSGVGYGEVIKLPHRTQSQRSSNS